MNALSNIDFRFYLALFMRRLPLFLIVLAITLAIGVAVTLMRPIVYQASARLLVESPQIPASLAKSTVPTSTTEQFQIIQEDVLSRDNLLAMTDEMGLYTGEPDATSAEIYDDVMDRLDIMPMPIESGDGTIATIFRIAFKASEPATAALFVNTLVDRIVEKDMALRTSRATDTVTFFDTETRRLDRDLRALDSQILDFKNSNIDALPDSIDFRRTQQTAEQQRLLVLAQEEAMLRKQRSDLQMRPLDFGPVAVTPAEQNLQALRQSLVQQEALFAQDSPTITTLRHRIAAVEQGLAGDGGANGTDGPLSTRELQMADIADRIAAIGEERGQIELRIGQLAASIAQTPGNETTLNSLQRRHQNVQAQNDLAVARLAEASTGRQIELLFKGERLSVIETAVPPQLAQGLGTRMLFAVSAIVALLAGLVAVALPELVNKRIRRPAELASRLQIAPFIVVPYIAQKTLNPARLALGIGVAFTIPVLLLATRDHTPVGGILNQAQASFDLGDQK